MIPAGTIRGLLFAWLALVCTAVLGQDSQAAPTLSFDHATTGFHLGAQHALASCESCHIQGVFRGTPRDCASCHRNGSRPSGAQFPVTHFPTTQPCDLCHRAAEWSVVSFRHQGVAQDTCLTCHNGIFASGKPPQHLATTRSCDTCHNTIIWTATTYNHDGVVPGTCATCHNGSRATGKPTYHIPTSDSCDTCHSTVTWATRYNHSGVAAGTCVTCHNRITAPGVGRTHIPTSLPCDACHKNYVSFTPATMDHTGLTGQCSSCHSGTYLSENAQTKPASHVSTNAQCDSSGCHASTTTWATATFNHALAAPPVVVSDHTCGNCHKTGGPGLSMPSTHIPTTNYCDICHTNFTAFRPATMSHDGTAGQCSACHSGSYLGVGTQGALAKSITHVPTSAQCDYCHKSTAAWSPTAYVHESSAALRCSVCHNGVTATGKSTTHIPDARQCDTCHTSTTSFQFRTMNHTGLNGQCSVCHGGAYISQNAQTKSASHTPTNAECDSCHNSTLTWATATINHATFSPPVTIGDHTCVTCHVNGGSGLPMPTTHIPTTGFCDNCHRQFSTFRLATMDHTGTNGACSTCHNGAYVSVGTQGAQAKPATHVATSLQCDSCHSTTAWLPASYPHDASAAGQCSTCHNGTTAKGKGATHIPDARQCDTCHATTTFLVSTMNHTGLAGQCSTCHNGAYLSENAQAKSAAHAPTNAQCDSCHFSTTTWATATFNHALASPAANIGDHSCANCHRTGGSGLPKPTNHIPTSGYCDTCHRNFVGFAPATMDHTGTNGQCSSCHNGAYTAVNADGKNATHMTTTASCDTCHTTSAWIPATFTHAGVGAGTCATCHGVSSTGKPSGHIPTTQSCDQCHRTSAWLPLLTPYSHTGVAAGTCATCHSASYANIDVKPATHVATNASCDQCHRTSAWLPATFNHNGVASGTCATCHGVTATGKPSNHIPTNVVASWSSCDACHKNYTSFASARIHRTAFTSVSVYPNNCQLCHERGNPYGVRGRPNDSRHSSGSGATGSCDRSGCHRSVSNWD